MKIYLSILLISLLPLTTLAQGLSDASSFDKVLKLAEKNQKPLMLIIKLPARYMTNSTPKNAMQEDEVVKKLKENFVVFDTDREDTTIAKIISTYRIRNFPTFLFMHATKDVFHSDFGISDSKYKYLNMLDRAIVLSKEKSATALEKEYLANKTDNNILKKLIELRRKNGLTDNASLIEQYANNLKISDFNDYETVLFILQAGPYLDGNAYKFSRTNQKVFDSVYKSEPAEKRLALNNAMIANTMAVAIKTKNVNKASAVANFVRGTWNNNYQRGAKASEAEMLRYFAAVKDTAQYFRNAINYYDRYYMAISADSIKKLEAKDRQTGAERMRAQLPNPNNQLSKAKIDSLSKFSGARVMSRTEMTTATVGGALSYANELNNVASYFYGTGTKNLNHLSKALIWSKRSIELKPFWGYYDTLAHIYYSMGIYNEALAMQKVAVERAKTDQPDAVESSQKEYEKMKSKTL